MAVHPLRQRIRWLALHGVIRGLSKLAARRSGDPQARLIADPEARNDPAAFADEVRTGDPVVRCRAVLLTVDQVGGACHVGDTTCFDARELLGEEDA